LTIRSHKRWPDESKAEHEHRVATACLPYLRALQGAVRHAAETDYMHGLLERVSKLESVLLACVHEVCGEISKDGLERARKMCIIVRGEMEPIDKLSEFASIDANLRKVEQILEAST